MSRRIWNGHVWIETPGAPATPVPTRPASAGAVVAPTEPATVARQIAEAHARLDARADALLKREVELDKASDKLALDLAALRVEQETFERIRSAK